MRVWRNCECAKHLSKQSCALREQTALDSGSSEGDLILYAGMAELADALDSGSSEGNFVQVQVLLPAPADSVGTQSSGVVIETPDLITRWWGSDLSLYAAPKKLKG